MLFFPSLNQLRARCFQYTWHVAIGTYLLQYVTCANHDPLAISLKYLCKKNFSRATTRIPTVAIPSYSFLNLKHCNFHCTPIGAVAPDRAIPIHCNPTITHLTTLSTKPEPSPSQLLPLELSPNPPHFSPCPTSLVYLTCAHSLAPSAFPPPQGQHR